MEKIYKNFIFIIIVLLWSIELITMNENSNGIISRKIIGRLFYILSTVYIFLSKYLNYKVNGKIVKKLLNISCSLDYVWSCSELYFSNKGFKIKYLQKALKLNPNNDTLNENASIYYKLKNNKIKSNKYLNNIKNPEIKRHFKLVNSAEKLDFDKMKIFKNDYKTYNDPKNYFQNNLKYYSIIINLILHEFKKDFIVTNKFYDKILDAVKYKNNRMTINFKNDTYYLHPFFVIMIARINYYGLSSKGKDIKEAKNNLKKIHNYEIYKNILHEFYVNEYNKINNHKL